VGLTGLLRANGGGPAKGRRGSAAVSIPDHLLRRSELPLSPRNGLLHRSKIHAYSITASAATCKVCGTVRPSTFAVLRLITNSNLVGCITGRSAGLAPLSILPT
jgi:hypothetical protein